jgi:hypothetical protein
MTRELYPAIRNLAAVSYAKVAAEKPKERKMPRLKRNAFIDKHQKGICVNLTFSDYYHAKRRAKGGSLKLAGTAKTIPTPNELLAALGAKMKGDYVLESNKTAFQRFILAEEQDAKALLKMFPHERAQTSAPGECNLVFNAMVDEAPFINLAKALKLL